MSPVLIIVLLFAVALILFAIEVYLVPGISIAGITATLCTAAALALAYTHFGWGVLMLTILVFTVIFFIFLWAFSRSRTLRRNALHAQIDSVSTPEEQLAVRAGQEGVALTRLALIGKARIGHYDVEVKSEEGFIDEHTPIVVTRSVEGVVWVKRKDETKA